NSLEDHITAQKNSQENFNTNLLWSFRYKRPITKLLNIVSSYKGTYKKLVMNDSYTLYDTLKQLYVEDVTRMVLQNQYENTHSLSLSGSGAVANFQYDLGVFIEYITSTIKNNVSGSDYVTHFHSFNPSFLISKDLSENGRIRFSYTRRTYYPLNKFLNPYTDYSDSTHLIVGNPKLIPGIRTTYSAKYSIIDGNYGGDISASYSLTTNGIQSVSTLINSTVMRTTYENLATQKSYGIDLSFSGRFFNWLEIGPNLSVDQNEFISPTVNTKGRGWSSYMRTKLSFDQFKFQFDFQYSPSSVYAQQTNKANFSANAAAKTLLFDKSLSLTFRVTDIFNTKNNNYDRSGSNFSMINSTRENTRIFTLYISYFFQSKANDIIEEPLEEVPDDF
ncbi:MAG: TonB-dependent receptor, partial [Ignavibacteria bacterium]|nr:TonB-dependent receptor [Ignavibacteria bacterium]